MTKNNWVQVWGNMNGETGVGLDSKKRIFSEKMRKDAKRGEKEVKRGYYVREKCI